MLVGMAVLVSMTGVADVPRPATWLVRHTPVLRCVADGGQRHEAADWLERLAGVARQFPGHDHAACAAILPPHVDPPTRIEYSIRVAASVEPVGPPDSFVALHLLNLPPPVPGV